MPNFCAAFGRNKAWFLSVFCSVVFFAVGSWECQAKKPEVSWESLVRSGNDYRDRARFKDAIKCYLDAAKIIEKQEIDDLRAAILYKDIATAYSAELKPHLVRIYENRSAEIYKRELENGHLGKEYSATENQDPAFITLRPACPLCSKINKVVPLHYKHGIESSGSSVTGSGDRFPKKVLEGDASEERWYCQSCKQMF